MSERKVRVETAKEVRVLWDAEDPRIVDVTREQAEATRLIDLTRETAGVALDTGPSALRHFRRIGLLLVVVDLSCLTLALLAAYALRFASLPGSSYLIGMVAACVLWVAVFHGLGLYAPQHLSGLEEFRRTVSAVGIGIVLVILLAFWSETYLARSWITLTLVIALILEVVARRVVRTHELHLSGNDSLVLRTLVVGSSDDAAGPMEALDRRGSGYLPIGFIDLTSPMIASDGLSPAERVTRLRGVLRQHRPDCVFVTSPTIAKGQMVALIQAARQEGIVVRIYTHLSGVWASRLTVQPLGKDGVALTLKPARLSRPQRFVKRGMDLVLAVIGLIVVSPLLLPAALVVKLTSRGPVLFRQERVTEGGRIFRMFKLRTMTVGPAQPAEGDAVDTSVPFFKLKSDPRTTRVGTWLRKSSIDELPQLLNVVLGQMSLVGPRPLPAEQVAANIELLGPRHEVRAGITGWWQIHGRSDLDPEEAVRMDHFYIENWSPMLDAYILLRTIGVLFTRRGAY
jgi:exopolysaccharide biosynthesis polyprenyl glycosylphosphotransferase